MILFEREGHELVIQCVRFAENFALKANLSHNLKRKITLLIFVVNNKKRSVCLFGVIFWRNTSTTRLAFCYNFEVLTKSTSPQLLRSQDFDQLSRLRRSGNDQHYKSLLAQLRCYQNDRLDWSIAFLVKGDRMQIPFKLAAYL